MYSLRKLPEEILRPVRSVSLEKYDVKSPTDIFYHHGSFVILDSHSEYCFNVLDLEHETKTGIIRKGRGPCEAIAYSISFCEDEPFLYDMGSAACVRVNIDSSIASSRPILDTISVLHNNRGTPAPLQMAGEFFLSPYPYESGAWYVLRNREGKVLSKLRAPSYPVLSEMNTNVYYSFIMSSFCTFNPHNSKMCAVSVNSPTISFSDIMKTELHEYKRYEYDEPIISEGGVKHLVDFRKEHFLDQCLMMYMCIFCIQVSLFLGARIICRLMKTIISLYMTGKVSLGVILFFLNIFAQCV